MREAIEATLTELLTGTELFFFDELHVHDPGSAALLNNLLAEIAERGIPTLITSNYAPEGLLPDEMFHHVIEPSITILREQFVIEELDGGTDYRRQVASRTGGFASGHWLTVGPGQATQDALLSIGEIAPGSDEVVTVLEGHRVLQASAVRGSQIWFDFASLLGTRSVTHDYLELAEQFDAWILMGVPRLSQMDPAARQRLVTLIDVLVERDRPLIVCSEVSREELVDIADPPPICSASKADCNSCSNRSPFEEFNTPGPGVCDSATFRLDRARKLRMARQQECQQIRTLWKDPFHVTKACPLAAAATALALTACGDADADESADGTSLTPQAESALSSNRCASPTPVSKGWKPSCWNSKTSVSP